MLAIIATLGLLLALVLPLAVPTAAAAAYRGAAAQAQDAPVGFPAPIPAPEITARAALAVDLATGATLLAVNPDMPYPPASTTKMLTAIIVRQHAALDEVVTVEAGDLVDVAVYAHVGLAAGDRITVRDLLAGLLIPSGGDAARTLARVVGSRLDPTAPDPRAAFVAEMNRQARRLGIRQTHFVNADGRDAPGQRSTARDLAILGAALLRDPFLAEVVAQPVTTVSVAGPAAREITLWSTNHLLGELGVHGVKTGTTGDAGENLVAVAWRKDHQVLTVTLGSSEQSRFDDTAALLGALDAHYRWVRLGREGDFPELEARLAAEGLTLMTNRTLLLSAARAERLTYDVQLAPTPGRSPWAMQGAVVFTVGAEEVLRLPVYRAAREAGNPSQP